MTQDLFLAVLSIGLSRCLNFLLNILNELMPCSGLIDKIMYRILTKCEVKMAGYWPSSFFVSANLWTSTPSRSINSQKRNKANIQQS